MLDDLRSLQATIADVLFAITRLEPVVAAWRNGHGPQTALEGPPPAGEADFGHHPTAEIVLSQPAPAPPAHAANGVHLAAEPVTPACAQCGAAFASQGAGGSRKRFCSTTCKARASKARRGKAKGPTEAARCERCAKPFSRLARSNRPARYCSDACRRAVDAERHEAMLAELRVDQVAEPQQEAEPAAPAEPADPRCVRCGKPFKASAAGRKKYCGDNCRDRAFAERQAARDAASEDDHADHEPDRPFRDDHRDRSPDQSALRPPALPWEHPA